MRVINDHSAKGWFPVSASWLLLFSFRPRSVSWLADDCADEDDVAADPELSKLSRLVPTALWKKEKQDHVIATLIEILKSAIHSLKRRIPLDSSYVVKEYVCIAQNLQFPLNPVNERSKSIRSRKKVWLRAAVWKITHLKCDNIFCLLWIQLIVHLALFCHTTTVAAVRLF